MCFSKTLVTVYRKEPRSNKKVRINMYVNCGVCIECKRKRVNDWVFRLGKEDKNSMSSFFITLTYNNENIPISPNGLPTLKQEDIRNYIKRLRKLNTAKIKYYNCGEYGEHTHRPHYHLIIFNVESKNYIIKAWILNGKPIGNVHIGHKVTGDAIAYTAKYIDKEKTIPLFEGDDRIKEYSTSSNGIGLSYLTDEVLHHYQSDYQRYSVIKDGNRYPLPRYYRKKIWTEEEIFKQNTYIAQMVQKADKENLEKAKELKMEHHKMQTNIRTNKTNRAKKLNQLNRNKL